MSPATTALFTLGVFFLPIWLALIGYPIYVYASRKEKHHDQRSEASSRASRVELVQRSTASVGKGNVSGRFSQ
jgi:hypothetical protein